MKVRELLSDESRWAQGYLARLPDGTGCNWNDPAAVKWDLLGAIYKCYRNDIALDFIAQLRQRLGVFGIGVWNDSQRRTFAEVKQLVEELDI